MSDAEAAVADVGAGVEDITRAGRDVTEDVSRYQVMDRQGNSLLVDADDFSREQGNGAVTFRLRGEIVGAFQVYDWFRKVEAGD